MIYVYSPPKEEQQEGIGGEKEVDQLVPGKV